jgi:hypothetical protein
MDLRSLLLYKDEGAVRRGAMDEHLFRHPWCLTRGRARGWRNGGDGFGARGSRLGTRAHVKAAIDFRFDFWSDLDEHVCCSSDLYFSVLFLDFPLSLSL